VSSIFFEPAMSEAKRRGRLYDGDLIVASGGPDGEHLVNFAREMLEAAFGERDPRRAQFSLSVEEFHEICAPLKPAFIHHPSSWKLLSELVVSLGCNPETTYLDVPRLRISTSDNYLTSGIAYAHHPHRDTWYSAPMCQINWWMPLYAFVPESAMAFHPRYWDRAVVNDSNLFNYYDWNSNQRKNAAQHVRTDTRWQPRATNALELEPEIRIMCKPGAAILFSGAQLHSTVPNTSGLSRYSVDFRTVDIDDVRAGRGAANIDSAPRGTSLRDFRCIADGTRMPEEIASQYDVERPEGRELIYRPV
jgi:hypothetical protein